MHPASVEGWPRELGMRHDVHLRLGPWMATCSACDANTPGGSGQPRRVRGIISVEKGMNIHTKRDE